MKKIVLDTNTIISALFWEGNPRIIYNFVRNSKFKHITSNEIIEELIRVLSYPKFNLSSSEILPIIMDYNNNSEIIKVKSNFEIIKEDITDNIFLNCAIDGKADYIVSGDHHLLKLNIFEEILIVNCKKFLDLEN